MAEAPTKRRSRRTKTRDPRERELRRLLLTVCDDVGFRLFLATYDQPKRRDELIARVIEEAAAERVKVTRLDIGKAGRKTNLVGLLRAHLQSSDLPPGWRKAVMVTGIEQRLDYSSGPEGYAFLHHANLLRDALPEAAPVPVVLWLSRMASAALPAEAPDLWHWRAASFDFTGDEAPRVGLLRELTTLPPDDYLELSGEQRRTRILMLEDLLEELDRDGPPRSKRQAAERASVLLAIGVDLNLVGRAADAMPYFQQALEIAGEIGDRVLQGLAFGHIGTAKRVLGDSVGAMEAFGRRMDIARELGDMQGEAAALTNLANVVADRGEPRRAIAIYKRALELDRRRGDLLGEGRVLANLGRAWKDLGEVRRAAEHYEQALAALRRTGDRQGEGMILNNLGVAWQELGDLPRAIELHEQALDIARKAKNQRNEGVALGNLGSAYANRGEAHRAIDLFQERLGIARQTGDRHGEGVALGNLGSAYLDLGDVNGAVAFLQQRLAIAREIGDRWGEANAMFNLAIAIDALGKRAEAVRRAQEAQAIFEAIEAKNMVEKVRAQLAEWTGEEA